MQTSADRKLATITKDKSEIDSLLSEAVKHHKLCEAARQSVESAQQVALWHGWMSGVRLNAIKALIGHGDWISWLEIYFCKANNITVRTAQIYMKIDNDNAALRDKVMRPNTKRVSQTAPDLELLTRLKFDTIRKHAFGFVPEKQRPELKGNTKFARLMHHITVVNEFNRWKRRREIGLIEKNIKEERRDFRPIFEWMKEELFAAE